MKEFNILITTTTEKMITISAPDAETACCLAEVVGMATDIFDTADTLVKDVIAEALEDEYEEELEVSLCDDCIHQCPVCGGCTIEEEK